MGSITLSGMEFFAHHGYYDDEITRGNKFVVDLRIDLDTDKPAESDDLRDALNYELVYELIKTEMAERSNLLEHAAKRMAGKIRAAFPQIDRLELTLTKHNPPLKGLVQKVSVTITG